MSSIQIKVSPLLLLELYLQPNAEKSSSNCCFPLSISITSPLKIGYMTDASNSALCFLLDSSTFIEVNKSWSIIKLSNASFFIYALKSSILTSTLAVTL